MDERKVPPGSSVQPLLGSMRLRRAKQWLGRRLRARLPCSTRLFSQVRWELRAAWVRLNNAVNPAYVARRRRIARGEDLAVNVGCGGSAKPGWVNLDLMPHPGLSLRYDCRRRLPMRPGSAARIRCEHFFEHLDPVDEAPRFLRSCVQALRPGGVLRIVVPDAEVYLRAYASGDPRDWESLGWDLRNLPEGLYTALDVVNHVFRQDGEHLYAYDGPTLIAALDRAGFRAAERRTFGSSIDPALADDLGAHRPYSLYVEAVR